MKPTTASIHIAKSLQADPQSKTWQRVWLPQRTTKSTNRPTTEKEARLPNSTYKKLAVQCSADAFVVNQTLVLRISICGKNRQLLVAANRYAKLWDTTTINKRAQ